MGRYMSSDHDSMQTIDPVQCECCPVTLQRPIYASQLLNMSREISLKNLLRQSVC